ncbi:MAG: 16S rRNA (adenine(1518)-N(6)/adenine(1519)-N(6))-dimethyltransferase RsmA [Myxococcota bacterium]
MNDPNGVAGDPRDLLRRYGLRPKRSFSQNFLVQPAAVTRIVDATVALGSEVVELGPGLGALTHALLARGCRVTAVELDRDMIEVLTAEIGPHPSFDLIAGDAATFDFRAHATKRGARLSVTGNLPYQATGAILRQVIAQHDAMRGAVLMVQREVRDRLVAAPGRKDYGALSVFAQAACSIDTVCRLRPGSFYPPPKVESAVVSLVPRETPLAEETESFRTVVRAAFHTRRKTLRNALRQLGDDSRTDEALRQSGIDPGRRGETLTIAEFAQLGEAWEAAG